MSQRSTTSFIFTDLVGSTALSTQLDNDIGDALRQEHFLLLREVVRAHAGTVVKNLGDGLMVAFASATDATTCAVAIHQRLHHRNRRADRRLDVRIGLSVGEAAVEDGDYYGRPVIEAARLCATARGGQILATEAIRLIVLAQPGYTFEPIGYLELKGLPEPVRTSAVTWQPVGGEAVGALSLPPAVRASQPSGFFGRIKEQSDLLGAWSRAERGKRQLALISGDPGIGKTRLAFEVALHAHDEGATVLFGRCHSALDVAYEPFLEALRYYVSNCPIGVLEDHVDRHGGELARIVPELGHRLPSIPEPRKGDLSTERYWLFDAVVSLLASAAEQTPLVLVLDDLQWASASTLLLLRHLVDVPTPVAMLVVGTFRAADPGPSGELTDLLADLRRDTEVLRIELDGLSENEVVELMEGRAGHELAAKEDRLAREVARECDGSPFFVTEILRSLVETGVLVQRAGRWQYDGRPGDLMVPDSVKEVITRRIRRFDDEAIGILECASVLGREFDFAQVAALAGRTNAAVLEVLEGAERASLVTVEPGRGTRVSFVHALVQHTLYAGLGATRRMGFHLAAVDALEQLGPTDSRIVEIANHCRGAGGLIESDRAITMMRRAAELALEGLAFEQAIDHYRHALELLDSDGPDDLRYELLFALGMAQRGLSGLDFRESMFEAIVVARRMGDGARGARAAAAAARTGTFSSVGEVDAQIVDIYTQTLSDLGDLHPELRALLLGKLAVEVVFSESWERRVELCDEAIRLARLYADPSGLAEVTLARIQALYDQTTIEGRLELTGELLTVAEQLRSREMLFQGNLLRSGALLEIGELEASLAHAAESRRLAEEIGRPLLRWQAALATAWESMVAGPQIAESKATEFFGLNSQDRSALTAFAAHLFQIRWDQGRLGELTDLLMQRVAEMPLAPAWRGGLAVALCEEGRLDEAREHFEWFADRGFLLPRDYVWWIGMVNVCEVCLALRDRERARILLELIEPWADQVAVMGVGMTTFGAADRTRASLEALLGDFDAAEAHFDHALELNNRLGARTFMVRTRRSYAEMLLARGKPGDVRRAETLVADALHDAAELGMVRERERLEGIACDSSAATQRGASPA